MLARVLVTGVTGFIGYSLASALLRRGHEVWGLVRFVADSYPRDVPEGVKPVVGDLTDYTSVARAVRAVRPEVVLHLAALTPVSMSYRMPRAYCEVNYVGTVNLVEAVVRSCEGLRLFAYASTSEVYGQQEVPSAGLDEGIQPRPNTPYAVAKYAGECYVRFYATEAYGLPAVALRPFNTYGRAFRRQEHFVVEKLLVAAARGDEAVVLGDPSPERDFIFRDDHVAAYLALLDAVLDGRVKPEGQVYNVASGRSVTIAQLAEIVKDVTGWGGNVRWAGRVRPADIRVLRGNPAKAQYELGWRPKYRLEDGLRVAYEEWVAVIKGGSR